MNQCPERRRKNPIHKRLRYSKRDTIRFSLSKTRSLLVEKRARGSSCSLHEQKPKAPYREDHLLPPLAAGGRFSHPKHGKKCLVLDLDETLVHSSFKPVEKYDFVIPVEIEGTIYQVPFRFILKAHV